MRGEGAVHVEMQKQKQRRKGKGTVKWEGVGWRWGRE